MFDIITFGSATKDVFLEIENPLIKKESFFLELGKKIKIKKINFSSGGGGTNTAFTFSNQGFKTAYCGMIGQDDSGDEILKELEKQKINTSLIQRTKLKPTNYSIIINHPHKDRTILTYRGASSLLKSICFKKAFWFYIAPFENNKLFEKILNFANKNNIKVAVNPGYEQFKGNWIQWIKKVDIIFVNELEYNILKNKLKQFKGILNITQGPQGVSVFYNNKKYFKKTPNSKVLDRTGAGDSYASGFMSEYIRTNDIEKSMAYGVKNAISCLRKIGAKQGLLKK
ncbi:MAG: carbohydrate kinase family protein [Candidatus Pacebacteria bacterium]|nr:carbohydrate kinase family protein [Candidatus Paceibacterota bacterium]